MKFIKKSFFFVILTITSLIITGCSNTGINITNQISSTSFFGPFDGYAENDALNVYTEEGINLTSLPLDALFGFPGQGSDHDKGAGPVDVYYGSANETFHWAVVCSGVSAGHVFVHCLASTDGGKTYTTLGDGNAMSMDVVTGAGFLSPEIGYLCCRYTNDNGPQIYITEDGANTWERLQVSLPAELDGLRFTPESPRFTESGVQFPMHVYNSASEESDSNWYFMIDNGGAQAWICKTES